MNEKRLGEIPLFSGLDDDALRTVSKVAQEVSVSEGAELVREGDYSYELTVIDEGEAEVLHGDEVVATLGPGDVFGEAGVLTKGMRNATVKAKTPMRLITLTGWDLRRLRGRIPEIEARVSKLAQERAK